MFSSRFLVGSGFLISHSRLCACPDPHRRPCRRHKVLFRPWRGRRGSRMPAATGSRTKTRAGTARSSSQIGDRSRQHASCFGSACRRYCWPVVGTPKAMAGACQHGRVCRGRHGGLWPTVHTTLIDPGQLIDPGHRPVEAAMHIPSYHEQCARVCVYGAIEAQDKVHSARAGRWRGTSIIQRRRQMGRWADIQTGTQTPISIAHPFPSLSIQHGTPPRPSPHKSAWQRLQWNLYFACSDEASTVLKNEQTSHDHPRLYPSGLC